MNHLAPAVCEHRDESVALSRFRRPDTAPDQESGGDQMLVNYMNSLHMLKIYTVCNGLWEKVRGMRALHSDHPLWEEQHELHDALVADRVRQVLSHIEAWRANICDVGTQYRALVSFNTFLEQFPDHAENASLTDAYEQVSRLRES